MADTIGRTLLNLRISQATHLSSVCIVLFEHLITLDDEIDLIWRSSWTPVKVMFLLNRYYVLVAVSINTYGFMNPANMSDSLSVHISYISYIPYQTKQGKYYFRWQGWTELVTCFLADGILQMRLYALYSLNKKLLAALLVCFMTSLGVSGHIMATIQSKVTTVVMPSPLGGTICYPMNLTPTFYTFWIPLIVFECLLCGLAVFKGLQTMRHSGSIGRKLLTILIRDSIVYFFGICMAYTVCLMVSVLTPMSLLGVPIVFVIAIPCVLSNRVVLNIRAAGQHRESSRVSFTPIRFGQ